MVVMYAFSIVKQNAWVFDTYADACFVTLKYSVVYHTHGGYFTRFQIDTMHISLILVISIFKHMYSSVK